MRIMIQENNKRCFSVMFAKNVMWISLLTLLLIISVIPSYAEAAMVEYAPGQTAMTFEEYLAQGGETWFLTGKQAYRRDRPAVQAVAL